jgi:HEAT repeat protein
VSKRRGLFLLAILTAAGLLALLFWPREPRYANKTLSAWLQELPRSGTKPNEAVNAIRAMGGNALPALIARIQAKVPLWKQKLNAALDKRRLVEFRFHSSDYAREEAVIAFEVLGPIAMPAVPALLRALGEEEPRIRGCAARALGGIGTATTEVIPALIKLLGDQDQNIRLQAAYALGAIGPSAIRSLLVAIKDGDPNVQLAAMDALASVFDDTSRQPKKVRIRRPGKPGFELEKVFAQAPGCDAVAVVKILTERLHQEDKQVRRAACLLLGSFGAVTKDAVSGLVEVTRDPEEEVRSAANTGLYEIGDTNRLLLPVTAIGF